MPAQDTSAVGGQATTDPHAQLLSIQEKIAKQTGGVAPSVSDSPVVPPATAPSASGVSNQTIATDQNMPSSPTSPSSATENVPLPLPPKPVIEPEGQDNLTEEKVPPSVVDDVVNQLNGMAPAATTPVEPPANVVQENQDTGVNPIDSRWVAPAEPTATPIEKPEEKANSDRNDNFDVSKNPSDNNSEKPTPSSNSQQNPQAVEELTRADIFKMLGMTNITEVEKKKNLDEMEETIWQDFVESDLPQMLSGEQKERFLDLLKTAPSAEKVINFFGSPPAGGLPKDFEQKYLQKTLDFKAEIVKEQIETLLLANEGKDAAKVDLLQKAKAAAETGYWKKVEEVMAQYK